MLIELRSIQKTYHTKFSHFQALRGIDLTIMENEYIALMGPSGSGKSTLANIIGFLDRQTEGDYFFKGKNTKKISLNTMADVRNKEIGFIFQSFHLLNNYSVTENVMLPNSYKRQGDKASVELAEKLLRDVGLVGKFNNKPNELSGGQRQRVAIARALLNKPSILIADEPTGNLDSKTSVEIMDLINEVHRAGSTIILITHENSIAMNAKRHLILKDGLISSDTSVNK